MTAEARQDIQPPYPSPILDDGHLADVIDIRSCLEGPRSIDSVAELLDRSDATTWNVKFDEIGPATALDRYLSIRRLAAEQPHPEGELLESMQESTRTWLDEQRVFEGPVDYENYDRSVIEAKIGALTDFIETNYSDEVPSEDIEATRAFIESAFRTYAERSADGSPATDGDGSFAFIVPPRMSRNNAEYGEEVEPVIPILRYVPKELRAQMMVGLPPFVIDTYKRDEFGNRGYLIFATVYPDMMDEMPRMKSMHAAREHVNNAVDLAVARFGVKIAGLGATLPALTHYGRTIENPFVKTTTGHGGTTHLIKETVKEGITRGYINGNIPPRVAVLGLGAIGSSIAHLMADEFPDSQLTVYDSDPSRTKKTLNELAGKNTIVEAAIDEAQLLHESDIVISAITSKLDLNKLGITSLEHTFIVDDSQPGSFDPAQVQDRGGHIAWVVGTDGNKIVRDGYDYGTLVDGNHDLFGCEAEAAALAWHWNQLIMAGNSEEFADSEIDRLALNAAVTPQHARLIGDVMQRAGVKVGDLQVFGKLLKLETL